MSVVSEGRALGRVLCSALGIDPSHVRSIRVDCAVHGAAMVTVERYVLEPDLESIGTELKRYRLEPIEEGG